MVRGGGGRGLDRWDIPNRPGGSVESPRDLSRDGANLGFGTIQLFLSNRRPPSHQVKNKRTDSLSLIHAPLLDSPLLFSPI